MAPTCLLSRFVVSTRPLFLLLFRVWVLLGCCLCSWNQNSRHLEDNDSLPHICHQDLLSCQVHYFHWCLSAAHFFDIAYVLEITTANICKIMITPSHVCYQGNLYRSWYPELLSGPHIGLGLDLSILEGSILWLYQTQELLCAPITDVPINHTGSHKKNVKVIDSG